VAVAAFERSLGVKKENIDPDVLMMQKQDASHGGIE
jgi:hypothetical protein